MGVLHVQLSPGIFDIAHMAAPHPFHEPDDHAWWKAPTRHVSIMTSRVVPLVIRNKRRYDSTRQLSVSAPQAVRSSSI
jgi:hypothetical protein